MADYRRKQLVRGQSKYSIFLEIFLRCIFNSHGMAVEKEEHNAWLENVKATVAKPWNVKISLNA
jgi:hypothetical protein